MKTLILILCTATLAVSLPKPIKLRFALTKPKVRIMGGDEAQPHDFPYQAFLEFYSSTNGWYCGGSLISQNYVLTSASCCKGAEEATVTLGAHNILDPEPNQEIFITYEITIHDQYDASTLDNDIALIKLPESIPFSDAIQAASLPSRSDVDRDYVESIATVSGWGTTQSGGSMNPVLSFVDVEVVDKATCEKSMGTLASSVLCTSGKDKTGPCQGDSGGPLTVNYILVGITTGQSGTCKAGSPSAYTRVASYLDWIEQNSDVEIN